MKKPNVLHERWGVYSGKLRPQFPTRIVEIGTVISGTVVIPWPGFDGDTLPNRVAVAQHIVKLHNQSLSDRKGPKP